MGRRINQLAGRGLFFFFLDKCSLKPLRKILTASPGQDENWGDMDPEAQEQQRPGQRLRADLGHSDHPSCQNLAVLMCLGLRFAISQVRNLPILEHL